MKLIAEFTITLKTLGDFGRANVKQTGIPITADTRAERDRAFAACRKMFPDARQIALTTVARREEAVQ